MKELKNKVVALTGAGAGIGRALACALADEGCALAMSDVDPKGLKETENILKQKNANVTSHIVDVSDKDQMYQFASDVAAKHGRVHMIINNAGVSVNQYLEDITYEDFEWILGINLWGVVYGSKAFLPYLKKEATAHIVNLSSCNGFFVYPSLGAYCTTKYAVSAFTQTLRIELSETPVNVSCVMPGGIKTDMAMHSRFYRSVDPSMTKEEASDAFKKYMAFTSPEKAADIIISGIKKNKAVILVGPDAYFYNILKRLFPVSFESFFAFISRKSANLSKKQSH